MKLPFKRTRFLHALLSGALLIGLLAWVAATPARAFAIAEEQPGQADLGVSFSIIPISDESITFQITVTNDGPDAADGAILDACYDDYYIHEMIEHLPPGEQVTFSYTVEVSSDIDFSVSAVITPPDSVVDPNDENNHFLILPDPAMYQIAFPLVMSE